jgi:N-acetylglucosaminyldiphosphoundecaprenol N-acetyl-beta-D-mannosaminyltransferase
MDLLVAGITAHSEPAERRLLLVGDTRVRLEHNMSPAIESAYLRSGAISADAPRARPPKPACILNGAFDAISADQVVDDILQTIDAGNRGVLCTVNVSILMMMRSNPRLQRFVDDARWTVADGQPLVWASHLGRTTIPERVTGCDLLALLCARAARDRIGVYFLGASAAIVRKAVDVLRKKHPGLDVRGCADGYFGPDEAPDRARAVAQSGAQLLFVAMGVPRQEYFIEEQWDRLGANVVIGVGGSLDVIAGLRKRAPRLVQSLGLEWTYRLVQEPRRLFRRYLVTNSQFVGLIAWDPIAHALRSCRPVWRDQ